MAKNKKLVCFDCKKALALDEHFMLALERPYRNLFFHKKCFKKVEAEVGWDGLPEYITQLLSK